MNIILDTPVVQTKTIDAILVAEVADRSDAKQVIASIVAGGHQKSLVLWEGDAYDAIGQWTDNDVIARVKALYAAQS